MPRRVSKTLTVAAAQPVTGPHDVAANAHQHAQALTSAATRLVVFPELSLTGYELGTEPISPDDPRLDPLTDACTQTGAVALVGAPVREESGTYIAIIRVDDQTRDVVYRKQFLGGSDPQRFSAGDSPTIVELDGWGIGLGICKDTGSPRHIAAVAQQNIDLYTAGMVHRPEERAEQDARGFLIARTCQSYVVFASFAGPTGGEFSQTLGTSTIWAPEGTRITQATDHTNDAAHAILGSL